jgi:hypothetical protein
VPRSKGRSTRRPRKRAKVRAARARATQAAQREADERKLTPAQYRRRRVLGWGLVGLGVVVFLQHLVSHAGFFTLVSPGVDDIIAGYPLAGLLALAGAIVLSR